jgi:hypothetical protein
MGTHYDFHCEPRAYQAEVSGGEWVAFRSQHIKTHLHPLPHQDIAPFVVVSFDALLMASHFKIVASALLKGNVAPFLGAGVNLWAGRELPQRPPSAAELARLLAEYPDWSFDALDLVRASQYFEIVFGSGPLYRELRRVFNRSYEPTPVHELVARLPGWLRAAQAQAPLMITTNYDQVLERALCSADEEFDQIVYVANRLDKHFGHFRHLKWRRKNRSHREIEPDSGQLILRSNEYYDEDLEAGRYPVLVKIHGAVDASAEYDSYVITEDDYIEYLAHADASTLLPAFVGKRLRDCHILFLGYGLRDWNLRVLLRRIWGNRTLTWKSWAIQKDCEELDNLFWRRHDVDLIKAGLEEYTEQLREQLERLVLTPPQ